MLVAGTRIGPYEVLGPLGAGGMGEVVRARDARLGRDVAIKALPEAFAHEPERLARFEREARLLASLHHPNIAGIFGVEEMGGRRYLVLELVEGPTLADRLGDGPLETSEALDVGRQIATALEAAHEGGIVHRDLKPANIKVTPAGVVKVLDFGLAKGTAAGAAADDLSRSPTRTATATGLGVVLGTAPYMSPEQARGKPVDRRTDIWSFGCVLYECLTGRRLFPGETVSDVVAHILRGEPDWSALPAATPSRVRVLLRRCLRKDARERLRDIGDARIELAETLAAGGEAEGVAAARARRRARPALAAALVAAAALGAASAWLARPAPSPVVRRYTIDPPQFEASHFDPVAISHTGRRIAYIARDQLWVRDRESFEAVAVAGAEQGENPIWSPDDSRLAFVKDKRLYVVPLAGGAPSLVCSLPDPGYLTGGCWLRGDRICFAMFRGGIYVVDAAGGDPRRILAPLADEEDFHDPQALPDGDHVVAVAHENRGPSPAVLISTRDGSRRELYRRQGLFTVAFSSDGYLLLGATQPYEVLAVPFSAARMRITGEPVRVAAGAEYPRAASDGTLVYVLNAGARARELVWLDENGRVLGPVGPPQRGLDSPELSPDGRSIVYTAAGDEYSDVWVADLARGSRRRVTSSSLEVLAPHWSSDGATVLFYAFRSSNSRMWKVAADGSSDMTSLGPGSSPVPLPDGRTMVYEHESGGHTTLYRKSVSDTLPGAPLWPAVARETSAPAVTRDGRWIAFVSNESGESEVFACAFPGGGGRQQVSHGGGSQPFWSPRGDALYFTNGDTLLRAAVRPGASLALGEPRAALTIAGGISPDRFVTFAGGPEGRLLAARAPAGDPTRGILVVEHWAAELRRR